MAETSAGGWVRRATTGSAVTRFQASARATISAGVGRRASRIRERASSTLIILAPRGRGRVGAMCAMPRQVSRSPGGAAPSSATLLSAAADAGEQDQPLHHARQVAAIGNRLIVQPQWHARRVDISLAL